jgi:hypothetical protein
MTGISDAGPGSRLANRQSSNRLLDKFRWVTMPLSSTTRGKGCPAQPPPGCEMEAALRRCRMREDGDG